MIRTRFAPSPTGYLHIGNLRTAIYAYAMAKHYAGQFILRIEDTDQDRYRPEGIRDIQKILTTFSLKWDEYYVQSERKTAGVYLEAAQKLVSAGHAFFCQCPAKNAKQEGFSSQLRDPCRDAGYTSGAVKLKVPDGQQISYKDFVLGKQISWNTDTVYDATLLKSDGFPTYHLAAMTDDLAMQVSHILRGHDWMPSTPIHLLVFDYLAGHRPEIGHLTDIQSPNGGKLSKRRDSVFVENFLNDGYLPEALLNFVILLGWAPKDNRELFTLDEFVTAFDEKGFQKSNPLFEPKKLNWLNGQYIRQKTDSELTHLVKPYVKNNISDTLLTQIIPLVKDRLTTLADINDLSATFVALPDYDVSLYSNAQLSVDHLKKTLDLISSPGFKFGDIRDQLNSLVSQNSWRTGDYFMSLRIAICGSRHTPPVTETMLVLGQAESVNRISHALDLLNHSV